MKSTALTSIVIIACIAACGKSPSTSNNDDTNTMKRLTEACSYNSNDSLLYKAVYTYNDNNKVCHIDFLNSNDELRTEVDIEFFGNKILRQTSRKANGDLDYFVSFVYTDFDSIACDTFFLSYGSRKTISKYTYDTNKRLITKYQFVNNDTLPPFTYYDYIYTNDGQRDSIKYYIDESLYSYSAYEYNNDFIAAVHYVNEMNMISNRTVYTYNNDGLKIKTTTYNIDNQVSGYIDYNYEEF